MYLLHMSHPPPFPQHFFPLSVRIYGVVLCSSALETSTDVSSLWLEYEMKQLWLKGMWEYSPVEGEPFDCRDCQENLR